MRIYATPRRGYCASCEILLTGQPVWFMDETYCCRGCAEGGPCMCSYEADLADDGVANLGLLVEPTLEPTLDPVAEQPLVDEVQVLVRGTHA